MNVNISTNVTPTKIAVVTKQMASKMYLLSTLPIFGYLCYISACKEVKQKSSLDNLAQMSQENNNPALLSTILEVFFFGSLFHGLHGLQKFPHITASSMSSPAPQPLNNHP